jgi:hypothetical protein
VINITLFVGVPGSRKILSKISLKTEWQVSIIYAHHYTLCYLREVLKSAQLLRHYLACCFIFKRLCELVGWLSQKPTGSFKCNWLTLRNSVLLQTLRVSSYLIKSKYFMELDGSLPHLQQTANGLSPESDVSSAHSPVFFHNITSYCSTLQSA